MTIARLRDRSALSSDVQEAIEGFQTRHGTEFTYLIEFPRTLLAALHAEGPLPENIRVASTTVPEVVKQIEAITAIANLPQQSRADRARYLQSLIDIYDLLPRQVRSAAASSEATLLAPEREGRILAERLGCLPGDRAWTPQAKRIRAGDGLLVGVDARLPAKGARKIVILDGVVASGVTLMAMMHLTVEPGTTVEIFTCHATRAGALALERYARVLGAELTLHIGHISGALNGKFYAVDPAARDRMVLGDIGDMISPLEDAR